MPCPQLSKHWFIAVVSVDLSTLISMIAAAVAGAYLGVGVVSTLPRRTLQWGMGAALLIAALLFVATNLHCLPGGGDALGLHNGRWVLAVAVSCILGGLMMLGIGLYAPCLILVSLLGMNPLLAVSDHDGRARLSHADWRRTFRQERPL
jgi:uncharacterized membrane protein YfcA